MDPVVLSLCGKRCYLFNCKLWFFVNTPSCYIINQQQLQWATHVVPWVAGTYIPQCWSTDCILHEATAQSYMYYSGRFLTTLVHTKSNTCF